jgi:hypothetical protein
MGIWNGHVIDRSAARAEAGPWAQRVLLGVLLAASVIGMIGGTWDAAWHVTLKRETFWTPPHLLLYGGTGLAFAASAAALLGTLRFGWGMPGPTIRLRRALPLGFALVAFGAAIIIGAAPVDDFWHRTFGRDVDVWSFPHLLALAGGCVLNVGAVMVVSADARRFAGRTLGHRAAMATCLTVILWAAMFSLNWYTLVLAIFRDSVKYPMLAALVGTPALLIASMALGRGGATLVAGIYTAYTVAAHLLLVRLGFAQLPFPPALIVPAVAVDMLLWAGTTRAPDVRRALAAAAAFAPTFYLAEAASLAWLPHVPLQGPPTTPAAIGYLSEVAARPWDLPHILAALPFAIAVAVVAGLAGWWVGTAVQWVQGIRPSPVGATPESAKQPVSLRALPGATYRR